MYFMYQFCVALKLDLPTWSAKLQPLVEVHIQQKVGPGAESLLDHESKCYKMLLMSFAQPSLLEILGATIK